jgi:hypothetical protein
MPWTSDPGDSEHTSHGGVLNTVFRQQKGVDITIRHISGLNSHGLLTHCVRFAPTSHPVNGNTRYRPARYRFDRTGLAPVGLHQKVSLAHPSSPYSALFPARSAMCREESFPGLLHQKHIGFRLIKGNEVPEFISINIIYKAAHKSRNKEDRKTDEHKYMQS